MNDYHIVPFVYSPDKKPSSLPSLAPTPSASSCLTPPCLPAAFTFSSSENGPQRSQSISTTLTYSGSGSASQEWLSYSNMDKDEQTMSNSIREHEQEVLTFIFELPPKYRNTIWVKRGITLQRVCPSFILLSPLFFYRQLCDCRMV
jgi:hypothetical protein